MVERRCFAVLALAGAVAFLWAATPEPEIIRAVRSGDRGAVERLIANKTDVNAAQPDGTSALHWAVQANNFVLANRLIQAFKPTMRGRLSFYVVTPRKPRHAKQTASVRRWILSAANRQED